eukprot:s3290_g4.t1
MTDTENLDIGDSLPPYASEENKKLDAEIKQKQAQVESIEEQIERDGARVKIMTDHLVNVQQELVNTQQLVDAKKNETTTEEHLQALTNRQLGRLSSEIVRLQKVLEDTQDQINAFSNELMRGNEKLDQFKLEMNWNQEELEQWAIAARQKEEDELTLEKYAYHLMLGLNDAEWAHRIQKCPEWLEDAAKEAHCCHINPKIDPNYQQFKEFVLSLIKRFRSGKTFALDEIHDEFMWMRSISADPSSRVPGWEVVDLDLPPSERWRHLVTPMASEIRRWKWLQRQDSSKMKVISERVLKEMGEYGLEIRSIANATGILVEDLFAYNIAYELEGGCTSIVAQDDRGRLIHGRNLDFGLFLGEDWKRFQWTLTEDRQSWTPTDLRPLLRNVRFVRQNRTVFKSTVFLGYVGTLTAVKQGGFSVTVNTRYDNSNWAALRAFLEGKGSGNFLSLTKPQEFPMSAKLLGPAYVILGGTGNGEGAVLERGATAVVNETLLSDVAKQGINSLVQTNWDYNKDPWYDNRRSPAEHCLQERYNTNITFEGMFSVLAAHPNRNRLTTHTALMSAETLGSAFLGGKSEMFLNLLSAFLELLALHYSCSELWCSRLQVRELTLTVEKLTVENANRRKELDDLITDTQAKQMELDKTAELFRQLHDDRKKIIEQWEESVKSMKSRDSQLERLGEDYAANMSRKKVKEDKMKERKQFHEEIEGENEKMEQTIQQTDRQLVRMRMDYMDGLSSGPQPERYCQLLLYLSDDQDAKTSLTGFKDEVEVMKNQLNACISEKIKTQNEHEVGAKRLEQRKEKHDQAYKNLDMHKKAHSEHQQTRRDKEQMSQDTEKARQDMLNNMKMVEKEMKAAKESHYKESQELYRLRAEEATTLGAISGAQSAIKNLQLQISKLDQERQRQQELLLELLYAVDFQSQLMQRKVARVSGERTIEEKEEHNRKVEQLDKQMEEQKSLHSILQAQIKRQDAELKNSQRNLTNVKRDCEAMKTTMEELELQNTIMNRLGLRIRAVSKVVKDKEEALMQHDILKLEVKRLKQQLTQKTENLYSLENRKQQLQISMEEREKEIEVHTEVLRAQIRAAEEEKHKAAIELAERKQKIFTLKSKYDNVMCKVKKEDGEEQKSQAHYMIKAAQEKEELQRKGDELDDKIRRAEKEIRSLENTLGHLVQRNQKFKENLQTTNLQNQSEIEEKQTLEEQSRAANEVLFKKKKVLSQIEQEAQEDELQRSMQQLEVQVNELTAARDVLRQDVDAQTSKAQRAEQAVETARARAIQAGVDLAPEAPPAVDLQARGTTQRMCCLSSRIFAKSVEWLCLLARLQQCHGLVAVGLEGLSESLTAGGRRPHQGTGGGARGARAPTWTAGFVGAIGYLKHRAAAEKRHTMACSGDWHSVVQPLALPAVLLGSGSAVRRQILEAAGVSFEVRKPDIDEKALGDRASEPEKLVRLLAEAKADALLSSLKRCDKDRLILTADQVVTYKGSIREKPTDLEEALVVFDESFDHRF